MENKKKGNTIHYLCMIALLLSWLTFSHGVDTSVYADDSENEETSESENNDNAEENSDNDEDDSAESDENNDNENESDENNESEEESDENNSDEDNDDADDESSETSEADSEGFIIHSDKVEGVMDLAGALVGKVDISEGTIEGLTITKELDTGDERDPMVIEITSPGPVNVENLETETLDGGAPDFDEICGLAPACMEDVTMEVDYQDVEELNLPDTVIKTCFKDECDDLGKTGS